MVEVPPDRFEELVADALDAIPPELGDLMDNVAVVVEHGSARRSLLGRYEGVPLTARHTYGGMVMPDRITIFRRAISAICADETEVVEQIRITVVHEIAHHFGIGDKRLEDLGYG